MEAFFTNRPLGQGVFMSELHVRADARSILRNILNYFSDNHAYIQLLQNARRAEASEVRIDLNTGTGTLTVTDNGHGVIDPQDLLNIGKSEWSQGIKAEHPAGMGLFSVFKLGGLAEVRSGRWRLRMDYAAMCNGEPAQYDGLQPAIKGTQIRVSGFHNQLGSEKVETYVRLWTRQAEFMPFRTTIVVDGTVNVIEAFNPLAVPMGALRVNTRWGWVDLHTKPPQRSEYDAMLIQQGIATVRHDLYIRNGPWVRVHARPDTVNFALPDRDKILNDAKYTQLVKDVHQACVNGVVAHIGEFHDDAARTKLANLVHAWDKLRVVDLPLESQHLFVQQEHYQNKMTRAEIAAQLAKGAQACSFKPEYHSTFELVPLELLPLPECEVGLFKAMFPNAPVIEDISFAITPDKRGDTLWLCGPITLKLDNGEKQILQPKSETSVLVDGSLNGEFVPNNRNRKRSEFAVVHTCPNAIDCPNLDPWIKVNEEEMDSDAAEELWRTSKYAVQIAATRTGVPANATLYELYTLLLDRFGKPGALVKFKDATFEFDRGETINIRTATVEFSQDNKVFREVRLHAVNGYLQEVKS